MSQATYLSRAEGKKETNEEKKEKQQNKQQKKTDKRKKKFKERWKQIKRETFKWSRLEREREREREIDSLAESNDTIITIIKLKICLRQTKHICRQTDRRT